MGNFDTKTMVILAKINDSFELMSDLKVICTLSLLQKHAHGSPVPDAQYPDSPCICKIFLKSVIGKDRFEKAHNILWFLFRTRLAYMRYGQACAIWS